MQFNCKPNDLINCGMSIGGIKSLFIIDYKAMGKFRYADNTLSEIVDFTLDYIPSQLVPCGDANSFTIEYNNDAANSFKINCKLQFNEMRSYARTEFEKLLKSKLRAIVTDRNGRCWLLGETSPLRVESFSSTTGEVGGDNIYQIQFSCLGSYQPKQITCLDTNCFTSFATSTVRQSTFVLEAASTIPMGTLFSVLADSSPLQANITPLQPTQWGNALINTADVDTLQQVISAYPTAGTQIQLFYDSMTDIAYIAFWSLDTTFSQIQFSAGGDIYYSVFEGVLNIRFTLGNLYHFVNTLITVTDSNSNVVYSGNYGDLIPPTTLGVSGRIEDAYINVSQLYPTGTTFELEISGTSSCPTRTFTYTPEAINGCLSSINSEVINGTQYDLIFDYPASGELFRGFLLNYNGYLLQLYGNPSTHHSDFNQFQTDLINGIDNLAVDIDLSSITIIDNGSGAQISFKGGQDNICFIRLDYNDSISVYTGNSQDNANRRYYVAKQSRCGNVNQMSSATRITYTDFVSNVISGLNGQNPDLNTGVNQEQILGLDNTINDLAIRLDSYPTNAILASEAISPFCPTIDEDILFGACHNAKSKSQIFVDNLWKYPTSAQLTNQFCNGLKIFPNAGGQIPVIGTLSVNSDFTNFSNNFRTNFPNSLLIDCWYNPANQTWYLHIWVANAETISSIINGDNGNNLFNNNLKQVTLLKTSSLQHPNQFVTAQIEQSDYQYAIKSRLALASAPYIHNDFGMYKLAELDYVSPNLDISLQNNRSGTELAFYDVTGLLLGSYTVSLGTLIDTFDLDSLLAVGGYSISDVNFIVINNNEGYKERYEYQIAATPSIVLNYLQKVVADLGVNDKLFNSSYTTQANFDYFDVENPDTCQNFYPNSTTDPDLKIYQNTSDYSHLDFIPVSDTTLASGNAGENTVNVDNLFNIGKGSVIQFANIPDGYFIVVNVRGSNLTLHTILPKTITNDLVYVASVQSFKNRIATWYPINYIGGTNAVLWGGNLLTQRMGFNAIGTSFRYLPTTSEIVRQKAFLAVLKPLQTGVVVEYSGGTGFLILEADTISQSLTLTLNDTNNAYTVSMQYNPNRLNVVSFGLYIDGAGTLQEMRIGVDGTYNTIDNINLATTIDYLSCVFPISNCFIGDIIETDTYNLALFQKYEGFMAWTWDLNNNLNPSHPYSTNRPLL